jgi:flagellar motor switch protein FliN
MAEASPSDSRRSDDFPIDEERERISPASPGKLRAGEETAVEQQETDAESLATQAAIDQLLEEARFEEPPAADGGAAPAPEAGEFPLRNFRRMIQEAQVSSIDLLRDVDLNVKIELGRTRMVVEDVLKLSEGSVVELDKLAGDPVDVFVNDRLVARGEVLVLNDNFCVRINEIVAGVKGEVE